MEPVFNAITQISVIVPDAAAYAKRFTDKYGIGPWTFTDFTGDNTTERMVRGKPTPYAMRLALCDCLNIQLELIQPLDDLSEYARFLKEHGPGIHHIAVQPAGDFAATLADLESKGNPVVQSGRDSGGMQFVYVDMMEDLGLVAEICDPPEDFIQPAPDFTYP